MGEKYYAVLIDTDNFIKQYIEYNTLEYYKRKAIAIGYMIGTPYKTSLEAKIEQAIFRTNHIKKLLQGKFYIGVTDTSSDSWYKTHKENIEGELKKTNKWLEPHKSKYPHIFL